MVELKQAAPPGFSNASIFAINSANLKTRARVLSGDIVVNQKNEPQEVLGGGTTPAPPTLSPGVELNIGFRARTPAGFAVRADSIKVRSNATVGGDLFCNELNGAGASNLSCDPLVLPVFESIPSAGNQPPNPNADDVVVGIGQTMTLPEGDYGDILVRSFGKLHLTGGTYNVRSMDFRLSTRAEFFAPSIVHVEKKFALDAGSRLGPHPSSGIAPSDIILFVNGVNGQTGKLGALPKAAKCGIGTRCNANFYVPNGTLWLRQASQNVGQFIAHDVNVGVNARVSLDSFYGNRPPTADPQTLTTDGAGPLDIILTGDDPEGEDLTFSIVTPGTGPSAGALGAVTPIEPPTIPEIDQETGLPTGGTIQPPIVSASVTYTPTNPSEFEEDGFTFAAADPEGLMGTAVITINPFDPSPPPPEVTDVTANDVFADTVTDTPTVVGLDAGGPPGTALTFRVDTLPSSGMLTDSEGTLITSPGTDVPGTMVTYTPPAGQDGLVVAFQYSARDSITPATPCAAPTCDSAMATVEVQVAAELGVDISVTTPEEQPVQIVLAANPGGIGGGGSSLSAEGPSQTAPPALPSAEVAGQVADSTGDNNGDFADPLPGASPLLGLAGVDVPGFGSASAGSVSDAVGDALPGGGSPPPEFPPVPDLVAASLTSDGTDLTIDISFASGTFDFTTYGVMVALDTDQDANTGCDPDNILGGVSGTGFNCLAGASGDLMGYDFVIQLPAPASSHPTAGGGTAQVRSQQGSPPSSLIVPFDNTTDGFSLIVPLTALGGDDGLIDFRIASFTHPDSGSSTFPNPNSQERDFMPNRGTLGAGPQLAPGTTGPSSSGPATVRFQIEWDITSLLSLLPGDIESAEVNLTTEETGLTTESLETELFFDNEDDDGILEPADFEDPAVFPPPAATLPGPTGSPGSGTFSFSVLSELRAALGESFSILSIQGRAKDEQSLIGQGEATGLSIRTSASGNITSGTDPRLVVTTTSTPPAAPLEFKILSLPLAGVGILKDTSGVPISIGQIFGSAPTVVFTPSAGATAANFNYQVTQGPVVDNALVSIIIGGDPCSVIQVGEEVFGTKSNCDAGR